LYLLNEKWFFLAGEMMMSLLWFYRPEHTDIGRQVEDLPEEVFASRHRDHTSVACIEDKCYVMTINEYCRWAASDSCFLQGNSPHRQIRDMLVFSYRAYRFIVSYIFTIYTFEMCSILLFP
jgi:hypothetical protein